jgi:hypothetical protein
MDDRFSTSNPLFKKSTVKKKKVLVDERFKSVLNDDKFISVPGSIDKYGRKTKKASKDAKRELSDFYQIEEDEQVNNNLSNHARTGPLPSKTQRMTEEQRMEYLIKLSRGEVEGTESDDSSSEASSTDDDDSQIKGESLVENSQTSSLGPLDLDDPREVSTGEATNRIALQNCDWENLQAQDIM